MKRFLWLGVFFLTASWVFFIPQFTTPDLIAGSLCLIAGILCIIAGISRSMPNNIQRRIALLLVPVALALFFVPFPYNLGLMILGIGLLSSLLSFRYERIKVFSYGISFAGVLLLLQTLIFPFYVSFISHGHRIDILASVISPLANLLGLQTSTNHGLLFVQSLQQTYPVTVTWEKLGLVFFLNLFLGALVFYFFFYEKKQMMKQTMIVLLTGFLYLLLRFIAMLVLYLATLDLSIFWNPLVMILSFVPLCLLLMKLSPLKHTNDAAIQTPSLSLTKKHLVALLLTLLLACSFTGALLYQDPGTMKQGRILIDEYHSQWEDTTRPLDTTWYGLLSTYNYYSWAQWLKTYYSVQTNSDEPFTADLLNQYDILILKCPTESYTTQEIQTIKDFVNHGGGLYLIGDHTNVFGMNTFLNQVSEEFGIRFKTDATYELGTGALSIYESDRFYSHPVMRQVPRFDFMTSCTLEPTSLSASLRLENIILGNRITSEPGTYSTENFFRESIASPDSEYGYLLQAAAIKHGAGRVVAFTDSTVFSSFCVFTDGYPAFTLGVIEYLNRTNTYAILNILLFALAIAMFIVLFILLRNDSKLTIVWIFFFAGLLAFSVTAPFCSSHIDQSYLPPTAQTDSTQIGFDQQHSSVNISVKPSSTLGDNSNNYGTFYVWTQRLGCIPWIEQTLTDAIKKDDIIMIINPIRPFTETDVQQLTTFLEKGGRVLLMDSIRNPSSTANDLLGNFGIWITTMTTDQVLLSNNSQNTSQLSIGNLTTPYLTITGGDTLLTNDKDEIYAAMTTVKNTSTGDGGKLMVVVDSYSFSDTLMGGTFSEPTPRQQQIYDTEFFLLQQIL